MSVSAAESPVEAAGAAFRALRRGLARSRGFSLHLCTCDSPAAREQWITNIAASLPHVTVHSVTLGETDDDVLDTVSRAVRDQPPGPVMVLGLGAALQDPPRTERLLAALNLRRPEWSKEVPRAVVFWIPRRLAGRLTGGAPDFFDWRSDTIDFANVDGAFQRPFSGREWAYGVDPRFTREEQEERLLELRARLSASAATESEPVLRSRLAWWDELSDLLKLRGEVDEALRIRNEEELPVYERLGDVRSLLVGRTNLALTLAKRGRPDDARRILALLYWSLREATRMRLLEAVQIGGILEQMGVPPDKLTELLAHFGIDVDDPLGEPS